jgi:hypothetical protein
LLTFLEPIPVLDQPEGKGQSLGKGRANSLPKTTSSKRTIQRSDAATKKSLNNLRGELRALHEQATRSGEITKQSFV